MGLLEHEATWDSCSTYDVCRHGGSAQRGPRVVGQNVATQHIHRRGERYSVCACLRLRVVDQVAPAAGLRCAVARRFLTSSIHRVHELLCSYAVSFLCGRVVIPEGSSAQLNGISIASYARLQVHARKTTRGLVPSCTVTARALLWCCGFERKQM